MDPPGRGHARGPGGAPGVAHAASGHWQGGEGIRDRAGQEWKWTALVKVCVFPCFFLVLPSFPGCPAAIFRFHLGFALFTCQRASFTNLTLLCAEQNARLRATRATPGQFGHGHELSATSDSVVTQLTIFSPHLWKQSEPLNILFLHIY